MSKIVILVDLDKTLARYTEWFDGEIGEPVPAMLERVKDWLALGYEVRIFTPRVAPLFRRRYLDDQHGFDNAQNAAIGEMVRVSRWIRKHLGRDLEVTAVKDQDVTEIWDDRAVRVQENTGVSELHAAHLYLSAANVAEGPLPLRVKALVDTYVDLHIKLQEQYNKVTGEVSGHKIKVAELETERPEPLTLQQLEFAWAQSEALHTAFEQRTQGMETVTATDASTVVD